MEDKLQPGVRFYVAPNNTKIGPLTEEVIREKVRSGEYSGDVLAWKEGEPEWTPLSHLFPHLFLGVPSAVPIAPQKSVMGDRILALLVDGFIVGMVNGILTFILGPLEIIPILLTPLYATLTLASGKQATPGMALCKLKAVTISGGRIEFKRALLRSLLAIPSGCFFLIGYFWAFWDPQSQTLHDKFAGTMIVKA
jgi:uncharacterized RDD family membrane protein YckC